MAKDERATRSSGRYSSGEPSVTTILGVLAKPALNVWMCKQTYYATLEGADSFAETQKVVRQLSRNACDIGTDVHDYIEHYNTDAPAEKKFGLTKYYQAFHEWLIDYKPDFIVREKTVASQKHYYKGTIDMVAMIGGKRCIVDIKTGKSIYESVELQTSAYKQAYEEQEGQPIEECWCLLLEKGSDGQPTGRYVFEKQKYVPDVFNALVKVYNWNHAQ